VSFIPHGLLRSNNAEIQSWYSDGSTSRDDYSVVLSLAVKDYIGS
jgi:hypothetical protein